MYWVTNERAAIYNGAQADGAETADQTDRLRAAERRAPREIRFPDRPSDHDGKQQARVGRQRLKHAQLNLNCGRLPLPHPLTDNTRVVVVRRCGVTRRLFVAVVLVRPGMVTMLGTTMVVRCSVVVLPRDRLVMTRPQRTGIEAEQRMHSAASQESSPSIDHEQK